MAIIASYKVNQANPKGLEHGMVQDFIKVPDKGARAYIDGIHSGKHMKVQSHVYQEVLHDNSAEEKN